MIYYLVQKYNKKIQYANIGLIIFSIWYKLVFFEFHPVVWMYDNDFNEVLYNYFKYEPIYEEETGTYADRYVEVAHQTITWNHSLSEVFQSLIKQNISIKNFQEFDYSHYNCFSHTEEFEPGKFRIQKFGNKIPMMYCIIGELTN